MRRVRALRFTVEPGRIAVAGDVNREGAPVGGTVGDRVALSRDLGAPRLVLQLVAEETKQRGDPMVARLCSRRGVSLERVELAAEDTPVIL